MVFFYAIIFTLVLGLYSSINFYIGKRLWQGIFSNLGFINQKVYWVVFFLIVFSYILVRIPFFATFRFKKVLEYIGSFWFAIMVYSIIILIAIDIFRIINYKLNLLDIQKFFSTRNLTIFSVSIVVIVMGILIYGNLNSKVTKVTNYNIKISNKNRLSKDYRIVMVSDIHIGSFITKERISEMVMEINNLKPDIVVVAGDILDNDIEPFKDLGIDEEFKKLKTIDGVYAILGNHDNFGKNIDKTVKIFKESNMNMLIDDIDIVNNEINLIGRNDTSMSTRSEHKRKNLDVIMKDLDNNKVNILLDHQPVEIEKAVSEKVDIMLSGHTHAGQFFPIRFFTKKIFKNDWGYVKFDSLHSIVSCGFGTWGPPIRVGTDSEIVSIDITNK